MEIKKLTKIKLFWHSYLLSSPLFLDLEKTMINTSSFLNNFL